MLRRVENDARITHRRHAEHRPHVRRSQHAGRPLMVRGDVVVRIRDGDQVRLGRRSGPRILHGRRSAAGAREVVRGDDPAVVGEHLTGRGADRQIRRRPLGANAPVHLGARIRVEIEVLTRVQRRKGVRTGGDGLRLVRRDMPTGGRLPRDDAAQVPIERQHVHRHQPAASALDDESPRYGRRFTCNGCAPGSSGEAVADAGAAA